MSKALWLLALACLVPGLAFRHARAAEGGYSNYIPGTYGDFAMAVAPSETWTLRNDVYYYDASGDRALRSGKLEVGVDLDFLINFTTLLWKPGVEVLGAQLAAGVLVPMVDLHLDSRLSVGGLTVDSSDRAAGLGDITVIPLVLYWKKSKIHAAFAQYVIAPTGDYDVDNDINDGLNYWSIDTNFALTYLDPQAGRELSFNVGHIYNTENHDTDYQTGRELHLDVALNQFLSDTLAVGLHGFYLQQITGDSGRGAILGDFEAEVAGVGPAVLWTPNIVGRSVSVVGKWLHEFDADNRLEGDHLFLSLVVDW